MSASTIPRPRKFLVVVDKTPECRVALRFAARRAQHTGGRVSLLCVAEPADFQQWKGVEEIMKDEAHQEAESLVYDAAKTVNELTGLMPELLIEHGVPSECLLDLVCRDKDISILVLASGTSKEGPGPLVSLFASTVQAIPVTIVPGNLTDEAVDELA
ncbi:MAG: universal stress protein [Alphaproteobacteria bacterium]|nr:universal stress protein [Alphaproteobacteria bacterium]MDE2631021.1 universal stress protein [Alphaproteobacteria bacterium]